MKKILINASPRGEESNSKVMLKWFNKGCKNPFPIYKLNLEKHHKEARDAVLEAEVIFIIMPVYVNSMPAQVMKFFELLEADKCKLKGKHISALIHLGFREGEQAYPLQRILENMFNELGLVCKGIIIRGGSEPTRLIPERWQQKTMKAVKALGTAFEADKPFLDESIRCLGHPMVLSKRYIFFMNLSNRIGLSNLYWNRLLKSNGVLKQRFDRPYV